MNNVKCLLVFGYGMISLLAGCEREHLSYMDRMCLPGADKASAITAAQDVLAEMHFTIDKADVEYGFIRTAPLRAGQSLELWRSDNVGAFNSAEANLHTIRRTAEMSFSEEAGRLCIECTARAERMSMPERETVSPSGAATMFTKSRSTTQRLKLHSNQQAQMTWLDLGRDSALETEILSRLKRKLSHR